MLITYENLFKVEFLVLHYAILQMSKIIHFYFFFHRKTLLQVATRIFGVVMVEVIQYIQPTCPLFTTIKTNGVASFS